MGANAEEVVNPEVQKRIRAEQTAETLKVDAAKAEALRKMKEEEKRASLAQAEENRIMRQRQANFAKLNAKYLNRKAKAALEGRDWLGKELSPQWNELVSSFILQYYWIQLPPYNQESHGEAFGLFLRHFWDQKLVKRVRALASEAGIPHPVPEKETFFCPYLSNGKHIDYTAIDGGVRTSALNLEIPLLEPRFRQIECGIYANMVLKPRREVAQASESSK